MNKRDVVAAVCTLALTLAAACAPSPNSGNSATPQPAANTNPDEIPASFPPGSPQYMLANQPDFAADIKFVTGPISYDGKVVKRGESWRVELPLPFPGGQKVKTVTYIRANEPTLMVLPDRKQFVELPPADETSLVNPLKTTLRELEKRGVTIEQVGKETVDGHPATKYRATRQGEDAEMFIWMADDLKNLVVKLEGRRENRNFGATWTNVSLDPPASEVSPPPDLPSYTQLDAEAFGGQFSAPDGAAQATPPNTNQ